MSCSVSGCRSITRERKNVRLFRFPKDKEVWQKWSNFCQRQTGIDPEKTAYICSEHFLPTDYERNLKFEMGFAKRNTAQLLPNAVPSIRAKQKPIKRSLLAAEYVEPMFVGSLKIENEMISDCFEHVDVMNEADDFPPYELEEHIKQKTSVMSSLKNEIRRLKKENLTLQKAVRRHTLEFSKLQRTYKRCELERDNMEKHLNSMFTEGQIRKMKIGPKRRVTWSAVDVEKATELYLTSSKAYGILQKNNFPFPSIRTVQTWLKHGRIEECNETEIDEMNIEVIDEMNIEVIDEINAEVIEEMNAEMIDEMNIELI